MSGEWLVDAGIPAGLLAFYPLVIGLAQFALFRQRPQLLRYLHLGGWGLSLGLLVVFVAWRLSLRGQWLDSVPFAVAWLAAGAYYWLRRRHLSWPAKLYFGGWFAYPAALALAYLADKVFFVLVSVPLLAFLPTTTYYSGPAVSIRGANGGLLSPFRVQLLEPVNIIGERHEGLASGEDFNWSKDTILSARRLPGSPLDSVAVLVQTSRGQQVVKFSR